MSTEQPGDGNRERPQWNETPPAAPDGQEENSLPNSDHKSPEQGKQTPDGASKGHSPTDSSGEGHGGDQPNHGLEGINDPGHLMSIVDVEIRTGFSRRTVYHHMTNSNFPLPLRLGRRTVKWWSKDINKWLLTNGLTKDDPAKPQDNTEDNQADQPEDNTEERPEAEGEDKT